MSFNAEKRADRVARQLHKLPADAQSSDVLVTTTSALHEVMDFDGCANSAIDPSTYLPSGATHIELYPAWSCGPYWDAEYLNPDVITFDDIRMQGGAATTLHRATEGRTETSHRHRDILAPISTDAQLRATLAVDGATYGALDLIRGAGEPDFSEDDLRLIDMISPVVGQVLRRASIVEASGPSAFPAQSAVVILDGEGDILSMTPEAQEMISLIPEAMTVDLSAEHLNGIVHALWARARFIARGLDAPAATARVQLEDGRRMTLRATATLMADGTPGQTVLTMEPTSRSQLGQLWLAAHGLTPREEQIVAMLLEGESAQQIATGLQISVHTVRTHTKRIHEKLGVSSRPELTRMFIDEAYLPTATFTGAGGHQG